MHLASLQEMLLFPILLTTLFGGGACGKKPNILFILTDDQDRHMESVQHMKNLQVCSTPLWKQEAAQA